MSSSNLQTREKILKAAWSLLEAQPSEEVRMSDIAKAASISRQALYGHFPARAELLIATARYIDEVKDVDARLAESRAATNGKQRLAAYIEVWGNYIPEVHGVCRAFMAMKATDEAAAAAWEDRMQAVRHGCEAAVKALHQDGDLTPNYTKRQATDVLWMLMSVENWERLRLECGWSQKAYVNEMQRLAQAMLLPYPARIWRAS